MKRILFLLLFLLLLLPTYCAAQTLGNHAICLGTLSCTLSSTTAGNAIFASLYAGACCDSTDPAMGVSDTQSNLYASQGHVFAQVGNWTAVQVWVACNVAGGSPTLNFTLAPSVGRLLGIVVSEITGVPTVCLDQHNTHISATSPYTSGAVTTLFPSELVLGYFYTQGTSPGAVSPWMTDSVLHVSSHDVLVYQNVSATGTYNPESNGGSGGGTIGVTISLVSSSQPSPSKEIRVTQSALRRPTISELLEEWSQGAYQ